MNRLIIAAGAAIMVAGCGGEAPQQNQTAAAAALAPGQYEASWTVTQLRSTDRQGTPATNLKQGMTGTTLGCVGENNAFDPRLFAEDGDECTETSSYLRGGRINLGLTCKRKGDSGEIRETINGTYTAQGFEAEISVSTYLAGDGDYSLTRTVTGKRVGECPPATESAAEANTAS